MVKRCFKQQQHYIFRGDLSNRKKEPTEGIVRGIKAVNYKTNYGFHGHISLTATMACHQIGRQALR